MDHYFSNQLIERFEQMVENKEIYFFDSEEFIEIIEYYLDIADNEYAFKALNFAAQQFPESLTIKIKWLEYFVQVGELKNAKELIEDLGTIEQKDTDYLLAVAQYWSAKNNHYKAIEFYKQALDNKEEMDYILSSIGNEYVELDEIESALLFFKKSLEINPEDEFTFYSIIHCYEQNHQNTACISFLETYIDDYPYSENAWFQLGIKQFQQKEYAAAYQSFDYASVINPESVVNYSQKASCLEKLEYWEEAIHVYQEALNYEDNKALLMLNMAKCFKKLKKEHHALKILLQALVEDPNQDNVMFEISKIYENLGNFHDALHYIKSAVDIDPKNAEFLKKQTYLHIKLQWFEEAINDFNVLLKLEPHRFTSHYAFSELLISIGEYEMAVEFLEKVVKKFHRAELNFQLSACYIIVDEKDKAIDSLEKAMSFDPNQLSKMVEKYPSLKEISKVYIKK